MKWRFVLFMALVLCSSLVGAAPRVGSHPGYTRVVFDLPGARPIRVQSKKVTLPYLTLRLSTLLRAERGSFKGPGVVAYATAGSAVNVTFAPGYGNPKIQIVPRQGNLPQRLVIDVSRVALPKATAPKAAPKPVVKAAPKPASKPKPAPRPRVVIDPGHGGLDPGMVSKHLREKDVTLAVGLRVSELLRGKGVDVVMTRTGDRALSANKRADLDARSTLARAGTVSAYISIHVNAGSPGSRGVETYYFGQPLSSDKRALAIQENGAGSIGQELTRTAAGTAQNLLGDILSQAKVSFSRDLAGKVQASVLQQTGAPNRGVHTNTFYVIRNPNTAAVLTEIGFGDSDKEGPLLASKAYQERVARGIAKAILAFLHLK